MTEAEQKVLSIASMTQGVQGKGSDLYEALVEAKCITRRTTAVRVYRFSIKGTKKMLIKIVNASNKIVFKEIYNPNLSDMEEF